MNRAKKRLDRVLGILKRFRQAVLAAACSGKLAEKWSEQYPQGSLQPSCETEPEREIPVGWVTVKLCEIVTELDQGWSPKCEAEASPSPEVWGVIKTTAVQAITFLECENKRLPSHFQARPGLELQVGDLLITRAGPRARAGVCCLVRAVRRRLMICDKVYRLRLNETRALPQFLVLALNSPAMIETIDLLKTGISDSGVNLTQSKFLGLEVALPSVQEQHNIVRRVDALFTLADTIERRVAAATARADKLPQAILTKAFRGELVPTEAELARAEGRAYEPASVLLERIRKEREAASATSARGKAAPDKPPAKPRRARPRRSP